MDTNSRLYFQSVQFNGTGVVRGLLASPCCPVWQVYIILYRFIAFKLFKKVRIEQRVSF